MPDDIVSLAGADTAAVLDAINAAAKKYEGVIPEDRYSEP